MGAVISTLPNTGSIMAKESSFHPLKKGIKTVRNNVTEPVLANLRFYKPFLVTGAVLAGVAFWQGRNMQNIFNGLPHEVKAIGVGMMPAILMLGPLMFKQWHDVNSGNIDLVARDRDLIQKAREGDLPPLYGRESAIERLYKSILCTDKANAILVGPAGVGKTAIVEGLAQKLANASPETLPEPLRNVRIVELKVNEFVNCGDIPGAFEKRMKKLMMDLEKAPNIIAFIDEIHGLLSVGSKASEMQNVLKPLLARGKVRIIGTTTSDEYAILAKDAAFARRFQRIDIEEPKGNELLHVVRTACQRYANSHKCKYTDEAISQAISSSKNLPGYYPDKALTLLDLAGTASMLEFPTDPSARVITAKNIQDINV